MNDLRTFLEYSLRDIAENEPMDVHILTNKLMEEVGELSEAVLLETGHLKHKNKPWSCVEEAADVIIVVVAILAKLNPDMNHTEKANELVNWLTKKYEKYERNVLHPEEFEV